MTTKKHRVGVAFAVAVTVAAPVAAQDWFVAFAQVERPGAARGREQAERQREAAARQRQAAAERMRRLQEQWPEVTESFSRTIRLGRNGTLDLDNPAGNVVITGGRGDEIRIEAVKRVRNPSEAQARRLLPQLVVSVLDRGGNVEVRTQIPRVRPVYGLVDYTIVVPTSANVTVRTLSGDVRVTNVDGELRAEAVNGDVHATDVRRVRFLKTMMGNIELADGSADELTASTMSGNLIINNLKGRFFDLQSVMGHVRLTNVEPDRVRLHSMNGDIEYLGRLAPSGRYEFQSHTGTIRLTPTNNQGFDVQASTFGGSFRSDYALKITEDTATGPGRRSRTVRATFGDAGAAITAHSLSGDIVIMTKERR